ncbi:MAG: hypothetical protein QNJ68_06630 [Microcoleaceae cyanobacterium MO_207.B10]|nr:hypothetical protein [Microcoleaceae cyanobacterium MO_207.B10]
MTSQEIIQNMIQQVEVFATSPEQQKLRLYQTSRHIRLSKIF